MEASFLQRHPFIKDTVGILVFISCVLIGTILINAFIFRSFNVVGPSMQPTMYTGDRLIVNRLPVTWAQLQNKPYIPSRGQVIVFKNPRYNVGTGDEYIVKRVIAFPGERVTVENGTLTVYNDEFPDGFHPDDTNHGEPGSPTSGSVNTTVTDGTLFVAGDHREGDFSFDSRSGLGLIPYYDVVGPVKFRIYPFTAVRTF
ncbi:MAG: lepB [Candidatus Saccharibacteria bacterium]|nr:lepB [Candidatus Saccharibacteria bacterium]